MKLLSLVFLVLVLIVPVRGQVTFEKPISMSELRESIGDLLGPVGELRIIAGGDKIYAFVIKNLAPTDLDRHRIYFTRSLDGGYTFDTPRAVAYMPFLSPHLGTVAARGDYVFLQYTTGFDKFDVGPQACFSVDGGEHVTCGLLRGRAGNVHSVQLAISEGGRFYAVWSSRENVGYSYDAFLYAGRLPAINLTNHRQQADQPLGTPIQILSADDNEVWLQYTTNRGTFLIHGVLDEPEGKAGIQWNDP